MRSGLCYVAGIAVTVIACVNIWQFNQYVSGFPPKESDHRFIWERRLTGVQAALIKAGYHSGNIGYMPAGVLKGNPATDREQVDWVHVRYTMIPLNVLENTLDAPFVVAETSGDLKGFTRLYETPDGWVLFQRNSSQ